MFHIYFLRSSEGLIFDVANANFDVALWNPLQDYLEIKDVRFHTGVTVTAVHAGERLSVRGPDGLSSPATALCWPPMCRVCSASSQARRNWGDDGWRANRGDGHRGAVRGSSAVAGPAREQ